MSDATADPEAGADAAGTDGDGGETAGKKKGGKGPLIGLVGALLLGGGGFFATYSGMLALPFGGDDQASHAPAHAEPEPLGETAFLPLGDIIVSLGARATAGNLHFSGDLEVDPAYLEDVTLLTPRILDVTNTYLRAVEERDLADPAAMNRIRAQLLRRIQIVTGEGRVRDLLITDFVLN